MDNYPTTSRRYLSPPSNYLQQVAAPWPPQPHQHPYHHLTLAHAPSTPIVPIVPIAPIAPEGPAPEAVPVTHRRAVNPYFLYRAYLIKKGDTAGRPDGVSFGAYVAKRWDALPDAERAEWKARAAAQTEAEKDLPPPPPKKRKTERLSKHGKRLGRPKGSGKKGKARADAPPAPGPSRQRDEGGVYARYGQEDGLPAFDPYGPTVHTWQLPPPDRAPFYDEELPPAVAPVMHTPDNGYLDQAGDFGYGFGNGYDAMHAPRNGYFDQAGDFGHGFGNGFGNGYDASGAFEQQRQHAHRSRFGLVTPPYEAGYYGDVGVPGPSARYDTVHDARRCQNCLAHSRDSGADMRVFGQAQPFRYDFLGLPTPPFDDLERTSYKFNPTSYNAPGPRSRYTVPSPPVDPNLLAGQYVAPGPAYLPAAPSPPLAPHFAAGAYDYFAPAPVSPPPAPFPDAAAWPAPDTFDNVDVGLFDGLPPVQLGDALPMPANPSGADYLEYDFAELMAWAQPQQAALPEAHREAPAQQHAARASASPEPRPVLGPASAEERAVAALDGPGDAPLAPLVEDAPLLVPAPPATPEAAPAPDYAEQLEALWQTIRALSGGAPGPAPIGDADGLALLEEVLAAAPNDEEAEDDDDGDLESFYEEEVQPPVDAPEVESESVFGDDEEACG